MKKFLSQRPYLNPPQQVDSFNDVDTDFQTSEELAWFCAEQHIIEDMLAEAGYSGDPPLQPHAPSMAATRNARPQLPQKPTFYAS
jgi:hypothetical protein